MVAWLRALFGKGDKGDEVFVEGGFGQERPLRPRSDGQEAALRYAKELFGNGLGYYYMRCHHDPVGGERELVPEVEWLAARAAQHRSADLFRQAAKGWDVVAAHCRVGKGADKESVLRKAIAMYEQALALRPDDAEVRFLLGQMLSARPQVRDFDRAKGVLEAIPPSRRSPEVRRLIEDIRRRQGDIAVPYSFDYAAIEPADIGHEVAKCTDLVKLHKKTGDRDVMRATLEHLYRLLVLSALHRRASFAGYSDKALSARLSAKAAEIASDMSGFTFDRLGPFGPLPGEDPEHLVSFRPRTLKAFTDHYGKTDKRFDLMSLLR